MKLYERIENNNFDEIDINRAIELIEGGNGHLVYNENYFKLQKENEELKEERKSYAEEYIHNNPWLYKQLNENYILRVESEQKERKAYIKGTNDADELCNKKWEDKIKAKIEEYKKDGKIINQTMPYCGEYINHFEIKALQSLLEKE